MLEILLFCGRDRCAWCLGILLGSLPSILFVFGCIICTSDVAPAAVYAVDDSLLRC